MNQIKPRTSSCSGSMTRERPSQRRSCSQFSGSLQPGSGPRPRRGRLIPSDCFSFVLFFVSYPVCLHVCLIKCNNVFQPQESSKQLIWCSSSSDDYICNVWYLINHLSATWRRNTVRCGERYETTSRIRSSSYYKYSVYYDIKQQIFTFETGEYFCLKVKHLIMSTWFPSVNQSTIHFTDSVTVHWFADWSVNKGSITWDNTWSSRCDVIISLSDTQTAGNRENKLFN